MEQHSVSMFARDQSSMIFEVACAVRLHTSPTQDMFRQYLNMHKMYWQRPSNSLYNYPWTRGRSTSSPARSPNLLCTTAFPLLANVDTSFAFCTRTDPRRRRPRLLKRAQSWASSYRAPTIRSETVPRNQRGAKCTAPRRYVHPPAVRPCAPIPAGLDALGPPCRSVVGAPLSGCAARCLPPAAALS